MLTGWPAIERQYVEKGWFIVDLPDPEPVLSMRASLQERLRAVTGNPAATLERFHDYVDDQSVTDIHWILANFFWDAEFSLKMGRAQLALFQQMIGRDLHIQYKPFLRFARPDKAQDNIGFHKDTQYGQSPYEIAMHVPFVDVDAAAALKVIEGSHIEPEAKYPRQPTTPSGVDKGSKQHMLGGPYSPKHLSTGGQPLVALAMKVGQAAIFSPALFHGQVVNESPLTRVTTDLRVVSSLAPASFKRDGSAVAGYVPLSQSPVSVAAERYFRAQGEAL